MCLTCVCSLLCKIISFALSVLIIVGLILLILWLTGVIFTSDDSETSNTNATSILRHTLKLGNGA